MAGDEPILEVRGLGVEFAAATGPVRAVDGVDLALVPGEMSGLVGESGSGKTTTALSILGLLPEAGRILPGSSVRLRGRELVGCPLRELRSVRGREVAMVFQDAGSSLNPVMPVGGQVAEAVRTHRRVGRRRARKEAVERLREVEIPRPEESARRYPHELSGGMRQRVALATALAGEPSVLLADEPTAALDVTIQAQILELLGRLRGSRGMAVLLVSHDLGVVAEACRSVTVLYGGRVMEEGPVGEVLGNPGHPYTEGLLGSLPSGAPRKSRLNAIPGTVPVFPSWPGACRFVDRCAYAWGRCREEPPPLMALAGEGGDGGDGPERTARCWLHASASPRDGPASSRPPADGSSAKASPGEPERVPTSRKGRSAESGGAPEVLLRTSGLRVHFRGTRRGWRKPRTVRAVDGVRLTVRRGETYGLVGESGCGKSTLARTVVGLLHPTAGSVRYGDTNPHAMDRREREAFRRRAQIVFQDPTESLNPRKPVGRALEEVLAVHGLGGERRGRRRRVAELLERVGLAASDGQAVPETFSGGQRQRIGIARALAVEPEFLVLDEPVSSLDVSIQAQILNLLLDLQRELGLTYVFISHDLAVVEHMSDRIGVMYLGRVMEEAPADHFARGGWHPYTRGLLAAVPGVPGRPPNGSCRGVPPASSRARRQETERQGGEGRMAVGSEPPDPAAPPPGCPYHPRCRHPDRDEECRVQAPPLEERESGHEVACWKVNRARGPASDASLDSFGMAEHLGIPPESGGDGMPGGSR